MKKIKRISIVIVMGIMVSLAVLSSVPAQEIKVEAAGKDKKKPKITLKGSSTLSANVGEKVTIPKTTYSDNKTKKKKLKVGVTVKKGNKNYKDIANKIKNATLKSKETTVSFDEEGTYKIAYTITDEAKNKKTATRTVVIKEKENQTTEAPTTEVVATTEVPTTEAPTTEAVVTTEETKITENISTEVTTEVVKDNNEKTTENTEKEKTVEIKKEDNTENQSTEQTTESNTESQDSEDDVEIIDGFVVINGKTVSFKDGVIDYSDFNPKEVTVDGKTYTVISDPDFAEYVRISKMYKENMEINLGARIDTFFIDYDSPISENCSYLKFFGNISANDKNGNDISQNIAIYEPEVFESNGPENDALYDHCYIYCTDENGDGYFYSYYLSFRGNQEYLASKYTKINDDPFVYVSYKK